MSDWSDLVNLIHVINNSPASSLESELNPLLNIPAYLAHRAFNLLFVNLDSYDGSGHNYYIYNNQGRFEWIAWDLNEAVGNLNMGMSIPQLECLSAFFIPPPQNQRPLPARLFTLDTPYRSYYAYLLGQWLQKWPPTRFEARVDSMAAVIRPYVYTDPMKFYTNVQFESNLLQNTVLSGPGLPGGTFLTPGLKSFYANRWQCLQNELQSLEYWHLAPEKEAYSVKVFPNPAVADLRIVGLKGPVQQIFISDGQGRMLTPKTKAEFKNSENSISLSISSLSPGLYQINILSDEIWHSARFLNW